MRINRIRIENIKSFSSAEINFTAGINLISGKNGVGKSTIIEAIGLALFNSKPQDYRQLIRSGAKSGEAEVSFLTDEGSFGVVRTIYSSVRNAQWRAYGPDGETLEFSRDEDIMLWLKERMGIEPSSELPKLFSQVLGVNQNDLLNPFLEQQSQRRQRFNRLFGVDEYERAADDMNEVVKRINSDIENIKSQAEIHKKNSEALEQVEAETLNAGETLKKALLEAEQAESEYIASEKALEQAKALKEQRNTLNIRLDSAMQNLSNIERELTQRKDELLQAQLALGRRAELFDAYKQNAEAAKSVEALEQKRKQRDELTAKLSDIGTKLAAENSKFKEKQRLYELYSETANKENSAAQDRLDSAEKDYATARREFDCVIQEKRQLENAGALLKKFAETVESIKTTAEAVVQWNNEILGLASDDFEGFEKAVLYKNEIAEKKRDLEKKAAAELERIRFIKDSMKALQCGNCPYTGFACPDTMIDETMRQALKKAEFDYQTYVEQTAELEQILSGYSDAETKLGIAREQKERIKMLAGRKADGIKTLSLLIDELNSLDAATAINEVTENDVPVHKYVLAENAGDTFEEIINDRLKLDSALEAAIQKTNDGYIKSNARLTLAMAELETARDLIERAKEKTAETQKYASEVVVIKEIISKLQTEEKSVNDALMPLGGIDEELFGLRGIINSTSKDAEEYLKLSEAPQRHSELVGIVTELEKKVSATQQESLALNEALEQLDLKISEIDQPALEESYKAASRRKQDAATKSGEARAALSALAEKLETLRMHKKSYDEALSQLGKKQGQRNTAELVKEILRKAGQRVSDALRSSAARRAEEIYRKISGQNVRLSWLEDYDITLADFSAGEKRIRYFRQLSGGEKMTAALAVRLALMNILSPIGIGFFDEPTSNLDSERRSNLAELIPSCAEGFEQLFFISHDDTFSSITENAIEIIGTQAGSTVSGR